MDEFCFRQPRVFSGGTTYGIIADDRGPRCFANLEAQTCHAQRRARRGGSHSRDDVPVQVRVLPFLPSDLSLPRYCPGDTRNSRLNTLLNAAADSYPTCSAIARSERFWSRSSRAASCSRQRLRYDMGDSPTSVANRAANGDRDIPICAAKDGTVHAFSGFLCSRPSAAPMPGSRNAPSHPAEPRGWSFSQVRTASTKMTSISLAIIVSEPRLACLVSFRRNRNVALSHSFAW